MSHQDDYQDNTLTYVMADKALILKAIQHPLRQEILYFLNNTPSSVAYTDLLPFCEESTGKLNYHLRILSPLIDKQDQGYSLSNRGQQIIQWMGKMFTAEEILEHDEPEVVFQKILPEAHLFTKYILQATIILAVFVIPLSFAIPSAPFVIWIITGLVLTYTLAIFLLRKYVNSYWYQITETEIIVNQGIITFSRKIIPFRTITNIEHKEGPFDRFFRLHTLDIHTAGNPIGTAGATEQLLGLVDGKELRETLLERIRLLNPPSFVNTDVHSPQKASPLLREIQEEFKSLNTELSDR